MGNTCDGIPELIVEAKRCSGASSRFFSQFDRTALDRKVQEGFSQVLLIMHKEHIFCFPGDVFNKEIVPDVHIDDGALGYFWIDKNSSQISFGL